MRQMKDKVGAILDHRAKFLCVLVERGLESRSWFPINRAERAEVQTLIGRPVTCVNQQEGTYVDEEGNVYQLADKGETKPIAVEQLPAREKKTELETLLEASLKGGKEPEPDANSKRVRQDPKQRTEGEAGAAGGQLSARSGRSRETEG